jgi:hypothetical protein
MPSRRSSKKDSPAKLAGRMKRRWRVVLLRNRFVCRAPRRFACPRLSVRLGACSRRAAVPLSSRPGPILLGAPLTSAPVEKVAACLENESTASAESRWAF